MFRGRADAWRPVGADGDALRTPTCYAVGIEPFSAVVWRASYVAGACNDGTTRCDRSALRMDAPGGALDQASTRPPLRSSASMPSSWILRVSVLRPQPEPRGGFHAVAAGVRERTADQRLLELVLEPIADVALAARERLRQLRGRAPAASRDRPRRRRRPAPRALRAAGPPLRRAGRAPSP